MFLVAQESVVMQMKRKRMFLFHISVFITSKNTEESHQSVCRQRLPIMQQCFLRSEIICVIS